MQITESNFLATQTLQPCYGLVDHGYSAIHSTLFGLKGKKVADPFLPMHIKRKIYLGN